MKTPQRRLHKTDSQHKFKIGIFRKYDNLIPKVPNLVYGGARDKAPAEDTGGGGPQRHDDSAGERVIEKIRFFTIPL